MSAAPAKSPMNANTILLSILIGISSWSLVTLLELKENSARIGVRVDVNERRIGELSVTVREHTEQITDLRIGRAQASH